MGVIYKSGIPYSGGGGSGSGTSDYSELANKPKINDVTLSGDKTTSDLGLVDGSTIYVDDNDKMAVGVISDAAIQSLFS